MKEIKPFHIRPGFRSLAVGLAASLLASYAALAVPYASQVVKSGDTVTFVLNQDCQGIGVVLNGTTQLTPALTTTAGVKTFNMAGYSSYQIIVTGNVAKAWTQISSETLTQNKFYSPRGVYVDTNPKRSTFGEIIVAESVGGTTTVGGAGRTTTEGLFILSADQRDITGQGNNGYGGGVDWLASGNAGPWKVSMNSADPLGQDYTIYISDWSDAHSGVWTADVLNLNTPFKELFNDTGRAASGIVMENGGAGPGTLHGSVASSPWVEGIGADRKMYTVDEDYVLGNILQYDIGTTTTGYATAPLNRTTDPGKISNGRADVVRDEDGSWWIAQYRSTDSTGTPALSHWADNATSASWSSGATGIQLNNGYGCLDIHNRTDLIVVGGNGSGIFVINISNPDAPTRATTISTTAVIQDVAFDAAGNIYIVSNSAERLRIYSPGGFTVATTSSDGTFDLFLPDSLAVTASDNTAAETGPDTATFTITRSGGPNAALPVYFSLSGTAVSNVDYTISPTSPFTFPAGQTSIDVVVTPIDDTDREPTETVTLKIENNSGYYVATASATATIADNDVNLRYWDANGAEGGASYTPLGTWGTDNFWSTSADGTTATGPWTDWAAAVFSAGADANDTFSVNVNGNQNVDYIAFEEGIITITGGSLTFTNFWGIEVAQAAAIDSVIAGVSGLTMNGPGTLNISGANTYSGTTTINGGQLILSSSDRIPDSSRVTIGAAGTFEMNGHNDTVGSLSGSSGGTLSGAGSTLRFGGDNSSTTFNATATTGAHLIKEGTGTMTSSAGPISDVLSISNGVVSINSSARFTGTSDIIVNGGTLRNTLSSAAGFVPYTRSIILGDAGGVLDVPNAAGIAIYGDASAAGTLQGGTLIKEGAGELRVSGLAMANSSFQKLVIRNGLYRGGYVSPTQAETFLGATPATFLADQITIMNGAILGNSLNMFEISENRGIVLGAGGGRIRDSMSIPGVISGTQLIKDLSGTLVLRGANTYTDGTTLSSGILYVRNTTGSGTGSGAVNVSAGTLGGDGIIAGPVAMSGGTLAPGYNYTVGYAAATPVTKPIALLTLGNGLDMSAGAATLSWQLGAFSEANPGTDFDQVQLTGGNLVLGSGATLALGVSGIPGPTNTTTDVFWQQAHQWKLISVAGGGTVTGNFAAITGTNAWTGGTFAATTDATGVTLVYTPASIPPQPVTTMTIGSVSGGNATITYSGGNGTRFVLLYSAAVEAPLGSWTRVDTNTATSGTFTIPVGTDPKGFYRIQSE